MASGKLFHALAFAFVATLSGAASARQPPALLAEQAKPTQGTSPGYRDMLARTPSRTYPSYESAGYRDFRVRLGKAESTRASAKPSLRPEQCRRDHNGTPVC